MENFDYEIENTFWKKDFKPNLLENCQFLYENDLFQESKKKKLPKKYFFKLYEFFLIRYESKNYQELPKDYINFYTTIRLLVNKPKIIKNKKIFSFTLEKESLSKTFYSENKHNALYWIEKLKVYTIRNNFWKNYDFVRLLGKGSFAEVFQVRNKTTHEMFSAKIIYTNKIEIKQKESLLNELQIMRLLKGKKHILQIFETFQEKNALIIITEFIKGGDLYNLVKNNKNVSEIDIFPIILQIIHGLLVLKKHKIIHKDLKLDNILIYPNKEKRIIKKNIECTLENVEVVICDFGLSEIKNSYQVYKRGGTPGYLAPEMFENNTYNEKIDVFSLGIIFFTLINGYPPFQGKTVQDILEKNKQCKIKYKKEIWDKISSPAKNLLKQLLEENSEKRISIEEIVFHEWIQTNLNNSSHRRKISFENDLEILKSDIFLQQNKKEENELSKGFSTIISIGKIISKETTTANESLKFKSETKSLYKGNSLNCSKDEKTLTSFSNNSNLISVTKENFEENFDLNTNREYTKLISNYEKLIVFKTKGIKFLEDKFRLDKNKKNSIL